MQRNNKCIHFALTARRFHGQAWFDAVSASTLVASTPRGVRFALTARRFLGLAWFDAKSAFHGQAWFDAVSASLGAVFVDLPVHLLLPRLQPYTPAPAAAGPEVLPPPPPPHPCAVRLTRGVAAQRFLRLCPDQVTVSVPSVSVRVAVGRPPPTPQTSPRSPHSPLAAAATIAAAAGIVGAAAPTPPPALVSRLQGWSFGVRVEGLQLTTCPGKPAGASSSDEDEDEDRPAPARPLGLLSPGFSPRGAGAVGGAGAPGRDTFGSMVGETTPTLSGVGSGWRGAAAAAAAPSSIRRRSMASAPGASAARSATTAVRLELSVGDARAELCRRAAGATATAAPGAAAASVAAAGGAGGPPPHGGAADAGVASVVACVGLQRTSLGASVLRLPPPLRWQQPAMEVSVEVELAGVHAALQQASLPELIKAARFLSGDADGAAAAQPAAARKPAHGLPPASAAAAAAAAPAAAAAALSAAVARGPPLSLHARMELVDGARVDLLGGRYWPSHVGMLRAAAAAVSLAEVPCRREASEPALRAHGSRRWHRAMSLLSGRASAAAAAMAAAGGVAGMQSLRPSASGFADAADAMRAQSFAPAARMRSSAEFPSGPAPPTEAAGHEAALRTASVPRMRSVSAPRG
eukprot:61256-Chlamydomonas_euryale.AAC.1